MKARDGIDCQAAFARLYEYLDGELDSGTTAAIKDHLQKCAACFSVFGFEKSFLLFLEARAKGQGAPASVRRKILESLLLEGEDGGE